MGRKHWQDSKLLSRLISNKTERTRWENINELRRRPSSELVDKCVVLIKSGEAKLQCIGIDILAQLGAEPRPFLKQTLPVLFEVLERERNPYVLQAALFAVGHNNDDLSNTQVKIVCSFSQSEDEKIKTGLVHSLLGIDHFEAIETMIKLSADRLSHIRDWATFGLATMIESDNQKIREALWVRANDRHLDTRLEALVGLAKRKDLNVVERIKKELLRKNPGSLLFEAILETENKSFIPLLQSEIKKDRKSQNATEGWIEEIKKCIEALQNLNADSHIL